jgi:hypothetical protein
MARDGEIDLSYVPTAEILVICFPKPLPKSAFLKLCAAMGMIVIGLRNGQGNGLWIGIRIGLGNGLGTLGNGRGNGIGIAHRNGIRNAVGKHIDSLGMFFSRRSQVYNWLLFMIVYCFV